MDGHLYDNEKLLEIPVKAGWKAGTKITFAGEGDEEGMKLASGYVRGAQLVKKFESVRTNPIRSDPKMALSDQLPIRFGVRSASD